MNSPDPPDPPDLPDQTHQTDQTDQTDQTHQTKIERLTRVARDAGVRGILLVTQRNVAWLTGGGNTRIDGSREPGAGGLFITADGRRFVIGNAIEMPRLLDEVVRGLSFEPIEYPWAEDHANAGVMIALARQQVDAGPIGADWPLPAAIVVEPAIARARVPFTEDEVRRYRLLGRDAGMAVGAACRQLTPGQSEIAIAGAIAASVYRIGARPIVLLVGGDDRIARFRHPVPTAAIWSDTLLVAVCAEREGLVVSLSRLISARAVTPLLADRTRATAAVFGRILESTREGATGAELFAAAARAYVEVGYPGEELRHHQGGPIGYRTREWIAHPRSAEIVRPPQAFAWNPTITGTKVEETVLLIDGRLEMLTATPEWPAIPIDVAGQAISVPDVLVV